MEVEKMRVPTLIMGWIGAVLGLAISAGMTMILVFDKIIWLGLVDASVGVLGIVAVTLLPRHPRNAAKAMAICALVGPLLVQWIFVIASLFLLIGASLAALDANKRPYY